MSLRLESVLSLNSSSFNSGINSAIGYLKNFAVAAIGVGAVEEAFRRTVSTAGELVDSAQRLDMTVEQVQLLRQAAKAAGAEFSDVASAIEKINVARAKALGGDKGALASFGALGVKQDDLKKKTGADLFTGSISNTVKNTNVEQITAPLRDILGKGASKVIATLKTDFAELGAEMAALGAIMSTEAAVKLDLLADEFDLLKGVLAANFAPYLVTAGEFLVWFAMQLKTTGQFVYNYFQSFVANLKSVFSNPKAWLNPVGSMMTVVGKSAIEAADKTAPQMAANEKSFQVFEAKLNQAVNNPKKADFNETEKAAKAAKVKTVQSKESDSLVKVGNFLGTNTGAVSNSAARMEKHAADTANNTKETRDLLKQIVDRNKTTRPESRGVNMSGFPIN